MHELTRDMGKTWRYMVSDSQYRWVGPEKGVTHLALAGVMNAVWDLWAKVLGKPVWRVVCDMSPEELVRCIDFRYITDAVTPGEAVEMLRVARKGREARLKEVEENCAVPAYSSSAGWAALDGDEMQSVLRRCVADGFTMFKIKVGMGVEEGSRQAVRSGAIESAPSGAGRRAIR